MKQIAPDQNYILLIAPVRKGRPQQSVAEGKTFPFAILRNNGIKTRLGNGGTDVSAVTLLSALSGCTVNLNFTNYPHTNLILLVKNA